MTTHATTTHTPRAITEPALAELRATDDAGRPTTAVTDPEDEAFTDAEVALVHVRAVEYGCFLYEVRRP